jgi:hypothetical protein
MRAIVKAVYEIDELIADFENICADDKKEIEDYTDAEIVHEAKYVVHTFYEDGHANNEEMMGEHGPERQQWARRQVDKLLALIKKYS